MPERNRRQTQLRSMDSLNDEMITPLLDGDEKIVAQTCVSISIQSPNTNAAQGTIFSDKKILNGILKFLSLKEQREFLCASKLMMNRVISEDFKTLLKLQKIQFNHYNRHYFSTHPSMENGVSKRLSIAGIILFIAVCTIIIDRRILLDKGFQGLGVGFLIGVSLLWLSDRLESKLRFNDISDDELQESVRYILGRQPPGKAIGNLYHFNPEISFLLKHVRKNIEIFPKQVEQDDEKMVKCSSSSPRCGGHGSLFMDSDRSQLRRRSGSHVDDGPGEVECKAQQLPR